MQKFFDKLSSYNFLNCLLPGAVSCFMMNLYWNRNFLGSNIIEDIFIYYFIGMVVSRIGSVIIEPICKKCKWVRFVEYEKYISASKIDNKVEILSETNNTFRTMLAMCILLILGKLYFYICSEISFIGDIEREITLIALIILFACSYRKQTRYIKNRVDQDLNGGV